MEVKIGERLEISDLRELGEEAVWSLSTAKPGNGVEQLCDDNLETYWQSDGAQPHLINIQFLKKMTISKLCFYLDYGADESYTPQKLSIRCGTSQHDLLDLTTIDLQEPVGWISIDLTTDDIPVRTHMLQIRILSMHQNGRDTHVRNAKVFGPRTSQIVMGGIPLNDFQTIEMQQYATIR
jgi:anaphase-promoting complex subunit 10